jgi:peptidoglycan hydrolase CwlO-like protein
VSDLDYDLVAMLRSWAEEAKRQEIHHAAQGLQDAANEIERLHAELADIRKQRDELERMLGERGGA